MRAVRILSLIVFPLLLVAQQADLFTATKNTTRNPRHIDEFHSAHAE